MKIFKKIETFLIWFGLLPSKSSFNFKLKEKLFKDYLDSLIKERGFIPTNEIDIIKKSWYDGYNYGILKK